MLDEELKQRVIQDVTLLKLVGFKTDHRTRWWKEISKWVAKAGMEPEFVNGLRKIRCRNHGDCRKWYLEKLENLWYLW